jgi:hypothetical protein
VSPYAPGNAMPAVREPYSFDHFEWDVSAGAAALL